MMKNKFLLYLLNTGIVFLCLGFVLVCVYNIYDWYKFVINVGIWKTILFLVIIPLMLCLISFVSMIPFFGTILIAGFIFVFFWQYYGRFKFLALFLLPVILPFLSIALLKIRQRVSEAVGRKK